MFRLKPVYVFLLLAILLTSCDLFSQPTKTPDITAPAETETVVPVTSEPTADVTSEPTADVTTEPTKEVTSEPTKEVTTEPTADVTSEPTKEVTTEPTADVTSEPTKEVTSEPTNEVTSEPTKEVTANPTVVTSVPIPTPPSTAGNCAISLSGQSFYISGGGGGLTTRPQGPEAPWDQVTKLVEENTSSISPTENVAILVADDFRGTSPDEVLNNKPDESQLAKPVTPTVKNISHGLLVYQHINTLLEKMGYKSSATPPASPTLIPGIPNPVMISDWEINSFHVYVVQVDSAEAPDGYAYNTDTIQQNVDNTIDSLRTNQNVARFVVNMSFSILPCKDVYEFEYNFVKQGRTFDDYKTELMQSGTIKDFGEWLNAESNILNSRGGGLEDSLYQYIQKSKDIVFVSSAGNFGDITQQIKNFRFYPGGWDGVINVSGFEGEPPAKNWWSHSNLGEVNLPAAWFKYEPFPDYYYAGTSFAAPIMSVIAALYVSQSPVACPFATIPPDFAATPYPEATLIPSFDRLSGKPPC